MSAEELDESQLPLAEQSLRFRLLKRASIRRTAEDRRSVQEGRPDRVSDLLEEAASALASLTAGNERLRGERDEAQSTVTAWHEVVLGIEAHIMDRIAMKDAANPELYLQIIRFDAANVESLSKQIVAARWADAKRAREQIERLESQVEVASMSARIAFDVCQNRRAAGRREGLEMAAKIADLCANAQEEAVDIAAAIRSLLRRN